MEKEVIIELLEDFSKEIKGDLSTVKKMLDDEKDEKRKERVIAYYELTLESYIKKLDKIKQLE